MWFSPMDIVEFDARPCFGRGRVPPKAQMCVQFTCMQNEYPQNPPFFMFGLFRCQLEGIKGAK